MARWELAPTLTPMRWELDTDRVRHGRASARLAVPSVSEGGVSTDETWKGRGWPAIHLTGEKLPRPGLVPLPAPGLRGIQPRQTPTRAPVDPPRQPPQARAGSPAAGLADPARRRRPRLRHRRAALLLRRSPAGNRDQPRPRPSRDRGPGGRAPARRPRRRAHRRNRGGTANPPRARQPAGDRRAARQDRRTVDADRRGPGRSRGRALGGTGARDPQKGWRGWLSGQRRTGSRCMPGRPAGGTAGPTA